MSNKNLHPDPDPHWFSYVPLPHFKHRSCSLRSRYILLLFGVGWSIAWLEAEMLVGICLLLNKDWALRVIQTGFTGSSTSPIASSLSPTVLQVIEKVGGVAGWVVLGSTGLNMCVVMWNWIQARAIVASDSIPRAFLDATAYRLWSIKSYAHFCLLARISWGRGFRQWIVMAVYFGLQGFMSALVTLPRLIVYGFILYSVRGIPDLALSSATFEMLGIDGFSALRSGLLKGSLIIIALSAILHTLYTVKILIAAAMCSCTICWLGRLKKAMDRDLKARITDLVVSTSGHNDNHFSGLHGEIKGDIVHWSHSGLESSGENQNTLAALVLEKDSSLHQQPSEGLDAHLYSLQDSSDGIVLGSDKRRAFSHHNNGEPTITVHVSPPTDAMPDTTPTDAILARDQGSLQDSSVSHSPDRHQTTLTSTQPTVLGASLNADGAQSTRTKTSELDTRRPSCQSDTNHLIPGGPGGRLTSLSFYDDLLKSISSERMMYAVSVYNQATPDHQQPQYEGDICGRESNNTPNEVASIARCSSIPLTLPSCSEYEYRSHADRPVHPFDVSQDHPTTTILFEQHSRPTMAELFVHTLDTADSSVAGFGNFPQPQGQERRSMSVYNNPLGLGQRGGPNSQAIENWRVLVEPRSPAFAELDQQGSVDDAHDEFSDSISRRGTIPMLLSSHLQEAAAIYEEDQLFTLEDLDAPRPFYAYGQTRTQRQGSVNSSTAGYNQSIASSPSLPDSLSNPMYHGITNFNSTGSRSVLPRKYSLPGSVYSSTKDDAGSSAPYLQNQIPQASSAPSYLAYPSSTTRTKAKTPSHLSNMIMHCDDTNSVDATEHQQSTSVQKKDHRRSQSQGVRSSQASAPSWDPFAKLAQTGCALTNIPHHGVDLNSLPQARAILDTAFQLSPPLLRRHSSHQRENLPPSSNADYTGGYDRRAGWNEQYVGLGLTFDSSTYTNQQRPCNGDMDESYRSPLDSYFDQTQVSSARSSFHQHWNHSEMRGRPNVPERLTSGKTTMTTTTELSGATTFTTPFQDPFTNKCVVTSYGYDNEHERNIALGRSPQRKETALHPMLFLPHQQTITTTRATCHHDNLTVHRQSSQRNKKNLVVNIVPLSC